MTFDEDESNGPERKWAGKLKVDRVMSEEYEGLTTDSVVQRTRTVTGHDSDVVRLETVRGVCQCGSTLDRPSQCFYSDLVCARCAETKYNGRVMCRMHVECHLGSKEEAMVLVCMTVGMGPKETGRVTGLSRPAVMGARDMLEARGHVKVKSLGIMASSAKVTSSGREAAKAMISSYRGDRDFSDFLSGVCVD